MADDEGETTEDGQCLTVLNRSNSTATGEPISLNVAVRVGRELFEGPGLYRMASPVRGLCVIINNINYLGAERVRHGSDFEGAQLENLFNQLGFIVRHLKNRTADQIDFDFNDASQMDELSKYDAFIGVILSHGNKHQTTFQDLIAGIDEKTIATDTILEKFNNQNCPNLIGKPKMFFIQACRGRYGDPGNLAATGENVHDALGFSPPKTTVTRIPTWTDTVVCFSTIDGFASLRNLITGSWFGDALIKVFSERACDTEFHHLLNMVSDRVSERSSVDQDGRPVTQSLEVLYRGWRKKLYFNPGLYQV